MGESVPHDGLTALAATVAEVTATFERMWLDEHSWVDVARGWVDDPEELCTTLVASTPWQQGRVWRYERWVDEPRLGSYWRVGDPPPHPALPDLHRTVQARTGVRFDGAALALYRDNRDSVAFHRDRELRWLEDTVIGVLSLGARRPWLLRTRANRYAHELPNRGATIDLHPASGDLLIMGGRCQTDWEHSVPKVDRRVGPRVSLQWRWTSRRGRPEVGANYAAPRNFSRR